MGGVSYGAANPPYETLILTKSTTVKIMKNILTNTAIAQTLCIPERVALGSTPTYNGTSSLLPTFRKLHIFNQQNYPIDDALAPLCNLTDLLQIDGESPESLAKRQQNKPDWSSVFEKWASSTYKQLNNSNHGFLTLIEDVIDNAISELETDLSDYLTGDNHHLVDIFSATLPTEALAQVVIPSTLFVYKRDFSDKSIEDYYSLLSQKPVRDAIFSEFPVLARLTSEILLDWIHASKTLAASIVDDQLLLKSEFDFDVSKISEIAANLGDRHNAGCTVAVLKSDNKKLVYKPRNALGENLIEEACNLLPELQNALPYLPRTREINGHMWQEFCGPHNFSKKQAKIVAKKLGVLNAILYFLLADDMHHENIQIFGSNVAVIDAECVLNTLKPIDFMQIDVENVTARHLATAAYTIGIAPQPANTPTQNSRPLDISVLGYQAGNSIQLKVPQLRKTENGGYSIKNEPAIFNDVDPITNRRFLLKFSDSFIEGFKLAAQLLSERRNDLFSLILSHPELSVRILPRPTMIYSKILIESYHPTFMRNAALRDACLGKLLPRYFGKSYRIPLLRGEIESIRKGYIPYVQYDLRRDGFIINDQFTKGNQNPLSKLRKHIYSINQSEIYRQCMYLKMSITSATLMENDNRRANISKTKFNLTRQDTSSSNNILITLAYEALDTVIDFLIEDEGEIGFATMNALRPDCWRIGPSGMDLYDGLAGLQLMFDRLNYESLPKKYQNIYRAIEKTALRFGDAVKLDDTSIEKNIKSLNVGLYDQLAGIAISQHLCMKHADNRDRAKNSLERTILMLKEMVPYDNNYDIISGTAGTIFLCKLLKLQNSALVKSLTESCIDHLLSKLVATSSGSFWPVPDTSTGLTGLAHGTIGIAASLALASNVYDYRKEESIRAIMGALAWERTHFSSVKGWADLRPEALSNQASDHLEAWCHGSGGAYLARQIILDNVGNSLTDQTRSALYEDITFAVKQLAAKTGKMILKRGSDCLCHGTIGNLILLQRAAKARQFDNDQLNELISEMLSSSLKHGWKLGGLPDIPSNGLMMGSSGIAWGLAHLACPADTDFNPFLLGI